MSFEDAVACYQRGIKVNTRKRGGKQIRCGSIASLPRRSDSERMMNADGKIVDVVLVSVCGRIVTGERWGDRVTMRVPVTEVYEW